MLTKFSICGALHAERINSDGVETNSEYRARVEKNLRGMGFPEVTEAWRRMDKMRYEEWKKSRP